MAEVKKSNRLKVKDIPESVSEDKLKTIFTNKRSKGGGPIEKIEYDKESHSAVITFEECEAVDKILSRGTSVDIDGATVKVLRLTKKKEGQKPSVNKPSTPPSAKQKGTSSPCPEPEEAPPKKPKKAKSKSEAAAVDGPSDTTKPSAKKKVKSIPSRVDVKRIVKLQVADVKKHLDTYTMYLEDDDELAEAFEENSIMLDGLNKQVFVTFKDAKDASMFRKMPHDETDTNISKVEQTTPEDLDYLSDRISVHVISDKPSKEASIDRSILKQLRKLTDLEIEDFFQFNEKRSGIIKLAPDTTKEDIAALTWKFRTKVKGCELIPAPVRCDMRTFLVRVVDGNISLALLRRYLQNKKSGGDKGVVTSMQEVNDGEFIVTMETQEMAKGIVEKMPGHTLEGCELNVEYFYPCLTKDMYTSWISSLGQIQGSPDSDDTSGPNVEGEAENSDNIKDTFEIDRWRYKLMERAGLIKTEDYKGLTLSYDNDNGCVVLEGAEIAVRDAKHKLLSTEMNELETSPVRNLESAIVRLLQNEDQLEKLQEKLEKQNCLAEIQCEDDKICVICLKSCEKEKIVQIIRKHAVIERKPVNPNMVPILESDEGQRFLKQLCEPNQENNHTSACVKLQEDKKCLLIVAPTEQQYDLNKKVDHFIKENKVDEKKIPFSRGQVKYMKKHLSAEKKDVFDKLHKEGLRITETPDSIVLEGLEEKVSEGSKRVFELRKRIKERKTKLEYFGIKEYLETPEGKEKMRKIEDDHSCLIMMNDNKTSGSGNSTGPTPGGSATDMSKMPKKISRISSDGCTVHVMQGDVTKLPVDALINPMDESRKLDTALGKAIVATGGKSIEQEFRRQSDPVMMTSAGQMKTIKKIFHLVCPIFDDQNPSAELKSAISSCLREIENRRCRSVAIPLVFLGKKFKFPSMVGCKMLLEALKKHIENAGSLQEIYLCDMTADNLRQLQECCENMFDDNEIEKISDLDESGTKAKTSGGSGFRSQVHHSRSGAGSAGNKFGAVKVNIVQGEVTKQTTDVIVITADKSLDLSKNKLGQAVLNHGGQSVQDELKNNYSSELKPGDFAKTKGGSLGCKEIYYACLTSYKGSCSMLTKVVSNQLEEAHQDKHGSIAFPALGVGGYKYPTNECAKAMLEAIKDFSTKHPRTKLTTVNLVIYSGKDVATFKGELSSSSSSSSHAGDSSDDDGSMAAAPRGGGAHHGGGAYGGNDDSDMTFGPVSLLVKQGNIIHEKCEAMVAGVKDDMDLSNSGYVCSAILKKCGDQLQVECKAKAPEIKKEGVTVTDGYDLKCKRIFYISQEQFGKSWDKGLAKVLALADKEGIKSLGFPLLGGKQANLELTKTALLDALKKFGQAKPKHLHDLRLLIHDTKQLDVFKSDHRARTPRNSAPSKYHGSKPSGSHPAPAPRTHKLSEQVEVTIYSSDRTDLDQVCRDFNKSLKDNYWDKSEDEDDVSKFDRNQIEALQREAIKHRIRLQINPREQCIRWQGFKSADSSSAIYKLINKIKLQLKEGEHQSQLRSIKPAFQWRFNDGTTWRDFEPMSNTELESAHTKNDPTVELTDASGRKYLADLTKMTERMLKDDMPKGKEYQIQRFDLTTEGDFPKEWGKMDENLKLVELASDSREYKKVEKHFHDCGATETIKKIQRIQNKALYKQYKAKKQEIEERNPKGHENEKRLFHGTNAANVDVINNNGFSRNYSGANATVFGEGVYFALQSSYSVRYAKAGASGERMMYQVRVLVGQSAPSKSGMRFLPNQPGTNTPYDSGVDGNGVMHIIFHDAQAYPEYLITF